MERVLTSFGKVDKHRALPSRARDIERLFYHAGDICGILHEVVVLCYRHRDALDIGFLEGIVPEHVVGTCPVIATIGTESM